MSDRGHKVCWYISFLVSVLLVSLIGYKWFQVQRVYAPSVNKVSDHEAVDRVLEAAETIEFEGEAKPYRVPTGFFIQSMAFVTPSDVNVNGYIWQKYPEDFPTNIVKGFLFPEEVNSGGTTLNLVYQHEGEQNGTKYNVMGWYFDVTVRQSFDYSRYPLDFITVWLRLWVKDFENDDKVIFVPDFESYADTKRKTFGLDTDIVPGEWEIDETFFSYNTIPYDSDFGFLTEVKDHTYEELFINLGMKRKFINAFIINLVPLFVVLLLLFATMMTVTSENELANRFGFDTCGAIGTCAALFFVVLLAHVQVRRQFAGSGLVYIEYFYLIMYLVILMTALNAYVFSLGERKHFNIVHFRDNFIPKVTFWPGVLSLMTIVTWIVL